MSKKIGISGSTRGGCPGSVAIKSDNPKRREAAPMPVDAKRFRGKYLAATAPSLDGRVANIPPHEVLALANTDEKLFATNGGAALMNLIRPFIEKQRWYGAKAREVKEMVIDAVVPLSKRGEKSTFLAIVRASLYDGSEQRYAVPLGLARGAEAADIVRARAGAVLGRVEGAKNRLVYDAMQFDDATRDLLAAITRGPHTSGGVALVGRPTNAFKGIDPHSIELKLLSGEQSNTSVRVGGEYIMKLFRRPTSGPSPDCEVGRFLTERTSFDRVPRLAGQVDLVQGDEPITLAMLQELVPGSSDAWDFALEAARDYLGRVGTGGAPARLASFVGSAATLGRRTGELHAALAGESAADHPDFAPEVLSDGDLEGLRARMTENLDRTLALAKDRGASLPEQAQILMRGLLAREGTLRAKIDAIIQLPIAGEIKARCHGDYHLGQVLVDRHCDFMIVDFEGEPTRSLEERLAKASPLKDVAGMLRSFDYAANDALRKVAVEAADAERLAPGARQWANEASHAFLNAYWSANGRGGPPSRPAAQALLDAFVLDKALYELDYELNNRPDWLSIPLGAVNEFIR